MAKAQNSTDQASGMQSGDRQLVSMVVGDQQIGVAISAVRDILGEQRLARVPLAQREIAGVLNLRGRIVTAIDLRSRLQMPMSDDADETSCMNIVVEVDGELYSLVVDRVGDVLALSSDKYETDTSTLPQTWRGLASGIFRLDDALLVELDIERVLALPQAA